MFYVFSQWLAAGEEEDGVVAEDGDEVGVVPGDDHQALQFLLHTAVCTGFFFLRGNGFVNFSVFLFSYFVH